MKADKFNRGDGYYLQQRNGRDLGEGPWTSERDALDFFDAEVGVTCRVVSVYGVTTPPTINPLSKWLDPFSAQPATATEGSDANVNAGGVR